MRRRNPQHEEEKSLTWRRGTLNMEKESPKLRRQSAA